VRSTTNWAWWGSCKVSSGATGVRHARKTGQGEDGGVQPGEIHSTLCIAHACMCHGTSAVVRLCVLMLLLDASCAAAAAASGPAAATGGGAATAAGAASGGAELMVQDLPDWGDLASDLNQHCVSQAMSHITELQQLVHDAGATSMEQQQQQQQQQDGVCAMGNLWQLVRRAIQQEAADLRGSRPSRGDGPQAAAAAAAAAGVPGSGPPSAVDGPGSGWAWPDGDGPPPEAPGSVQHLQAAVRESYLLLRGVVLLMAPKCDKAAQLRESFQRPQQDQLLAGQLDFVKVAHQVSQLLQDDQSLLQTKEVMRQKSRQRWSSDTRYTEESIHMMLPVQPWSEVVERLRMVVGSQEALLGLRGQQLQWRQWQRQQQWWQQQQDLHHCCDGSPAGVALASVGRAVYVLLVLRLLEPVVTPSVVATARVALFR